MDDIIKTQEFYMSKYYKFYKSKNSDIYIFSNET